MAHQINLSIARARLAEAVRHAKSDEVVPAEWLDFSRLTFALKAKTYTPVLGTVLLARATEPRIDPLSIKETDEPNSYSQRTVGHEVLVPGARSYGFSIRATGREPLNNQPFFRFLHMTSIDRVRDPAALDWFIQGVRRVGELDAEGALAALAAFLRVGFEEIAKLERITIERGVLTMGGLTDALTIYLAKGVEQRPNRLQAFAAAAIDLGHSDVRSRKINDPSRDVPGDVQAYAGGVPYLSMEVRGKKGHVPRSGVNLGR